MKNNASPANKLYSSNTDPTKSTVGAGVHHPVHEKAHKMDETKNIAKVGSDADMRKAESVTSTKALNTKTKAKSPGERLYPGMVTGRKAP